jgi:hypothetical protein
MRLKIVRHENKKDKSGGSENYKMLHKNHQSLERRGGS